MTIQIDGTTLTAEEVDDYLRFYPASKPSSVLRALVACKQRSQGGGLDEITVDYLMRGKEYGGLGMGVDMTDEDICHVRYLCDLSLS
jgi:hypothetical protein